MLLATLLANLLATLCCLDALFATLIATMLVANFVCYFVFSLASGAKSTYTHTLTLNSSQSRPLYIEPLLQRKQHIMKKVQQQLGL